MQHQLCDAVSVMVDCMLLSCCVVCDAAAHGCRKTVRTFSAKALMPMLRGKDHDFLVVCRTWLVQQFLLAPQVHLRASNLW